MPLMREAMLGVSVGTRSIGFAAIKGGTVIDWQIKSFKQGWSERKLETIMKAIDTVINRHNVSVIAVKTPYEVKEDSNMSLLLHRFEALLNGTQITLRKYDITQLKEACQINIANKEEAMIHVSELYPCMRKLCQKELQNRNPYHLKVFEAILAIHGFERLG